jgi:telomerase reverse transcriptase
MLIRLIDDFLYVTTSQEAANKFLKVMLQPNEEFGFVVNPSKTKTNFPTPILPSQLKLHRKMVWCGLILNTTTLEIMPDYSRYSGTCLFRSYSLASSCY